MVLNPNRCSGGRDGRVDLGFTCIVQGDKARLLLELAHCVKVCRLVQGVAAPQKELHKEGRDVPARYVHPLCEVGEGEAIHHRDLQCSKATENDRLHLQLSCDGLICKPCLSLKTPQQATAVAGMRSAHLCVCTLQSRNRPFPVVSIAFLPHV